MLFRGLLFLGNVFSVLGGLVCIRNFFTAMLRGSLQWLDFGLLFLYHKIQDGQENTFFVLVLCWLQLCFITNSDRTMKHVVLCCLLWLLR